MANPNVQIFLKLDGISGESTVKGHEKEIDVVSLEQGLEVMVIQSAGGGGATAGRPTFSNFRFRKNVDAASIPMLLACASGQHISEARFAIRRGGGGFEFWKVTLEDVLITDMAQRAGSGAQYPLSFDLLDSGESSDGFLEEVALNFSRIRWEHRVQQAGGGAGATRTGGWDVRTNTRL
jgi:type VI secretion system secreted protein Hcp